MNTQQLLQESERSRLALLNILEDQKLIEAKLRKSEAYNRLLFNSTPIGLALCKMDGTLVDVNPAYAKILGRTVDETLRLTYWDITPKKYEEQEKQQLKSLEETGSYGPYEKEYIHKDGHLVPVRLQGLIFEQEGERFIWSSTEDITERKKSDEALRMSEARFRKLVETEPECVKILTEDSILQDMNPAGLAMIDADSREQVVGKSVLGTIDPEYREAFKDLVQRVFRGESDILEFKITGLKGTKRWLETNAVPMRDEEGKIQSLLSITRDITERKRKEDELKKSYEKTKELEVIINRSPAVAFLWRAEENWPVEYVSENISQFGYSPEELLSGAVLFSKMVYKDDFERVAQEVISYSQSDVNEFQQEYRIITKTGDIRWLDDRTWIRRDKENKITHYQGIVLDITERKRAEEEIRQTSEELRAINKIITTSTSILDTTEMLDKVLVEALAIVELEGGTVCTIEPDNTLKLITQRESSEATIRDLTENRIKVGDCLCGNCANDNCPLILRDREAVLQYATREVLRGEKINFHAAFPFAVKGKCVGVLCVFTRTDKKPTERSLKLLETLTAQVALAIENAKLYEEIKKHNLQLEKIVSDRTAELLAANKELEAFSYSVSHDLRAPLRAIDGFSLALLEDYSDKLDKEGKHHLERVRNGATEMAQLIDDLLNLSRISRRELIRGSVDISKIVKSISAKLVESEPERKVKFNVVENVQALGDRQLLKIVMDNLLNNAWKFTSKKKNAIIEFGILEKEGKNVYYIKDNGVGFDMKYADKLFNPFQRLHRKEDYPGTGIGLATVRQIILKHGGSIWSESEIGKGASFYFKL